MVRVLNSFNRNNLLLALNCLVGIFIASSLLVANNISAQGGGAAAAAGTNSAPEVNILFEQKARMFGDSVDGLLAKIKTNLNDPSYIARLGVQVSAVTIGSKYYDSYQSKATEYEPYDKRMDAYSYRRNNERNGVYTPNQEGASPAAISLTGSETLTDRINSREYLGKFSFIISERPENHSSGPGDYYKLEVNKKIDASGNLVIEYKLVELDIISDLRSSPVTYIGEAETNDLFVTTETFQGADVTQTARVIKEDGISYFDKKEDILDDEAQTEEFIDRISNKDDIAEDFSITTRTTPDGGEVRFAIIGEGDPDFVEKKAAGGSYKNPDALSESDLVPSEAKDYIPLEDIPEHNAVEEKITSLDTKIAQIVEATNKITENIAAINSNASYTKDVARSIVAKEVAKKGILDRLKKVAIDTYEKQNAYKESIKNKKNDRKNYDESKKSADIADQILKTQDAKLKVYDEGITAFKELVDVKAKLDKAKEIGIKMQGDFSSIDEIHKSDPLFKDVLAEMEKNNDKIKAVIEALETARQMAESKVALIDNSLSVLEQKKLVLEQTSEAGGSFQEIQDELNEYDARLDANNEDKIKKDEALEVFDATELASAEIEYNNSRKQYEEAKEQQERGEIIQEQQKAWEMLQEEFKNTRDKIDEAGKERVERESLKLSIEKDINPERLAQLDGYIESAKQNKQSISDRIAEVTTNGLYKGEIKQKLDAALLAADVAILAEMNRKREAQKILDKANNPNTPLSELENWNEKLSALDNEVAAAGYKVAASRVDAIAKMQQVIEQVKAEKAKADAKAAAEEAGVTPEEFAKLLDSPDSTVSISEQINDVNESIRKIEQRNKELKKKKLDNELVIEENKPKLDDNYKHKVIADKILLDELRISLAPQKKLIEDLKLSIDKLNEKKKQIERLKKIKILLDNVMQLQKMKNNNQAATLPYNKLKDEIVQLVQNMPYLAEPPKKVGIFSGNDVDYKAFQERLQGNDLPNQLAVVNALLDEGEQLQLTDFEEKLHPVEHMLDFNLQLGKKSLVSNQGTMASWVVTIGLLENEGLEAKKAEIEGEQVQARNEIESLEKNNDAINKDIEKNLDLIKAKRLEAERLKRLRDVINKLEKVNAAQNKATAASNLAARAQELANATNEYNAALQAGTGVEEAKKALEAKESAYREAKSEYDKFSADMAAASAAAASDELSTAISNLLTEKAGIIDFDDIEGSVLSEISGDTLSSIEPKLTAAKDAVSSQNAELDDLKLQINTLESEIGATSDDIVKSEKLAELAGLKEREKLALKEKRQKDKELAKLEQDKLNAKAQKDLAEAKAKIVQDGLKVLESEQAALDLFNSSNERHAKLTEQLREAQELANSPASTAEQKSQADRLTAQVSDAKELANLAENGLHESRNLTDAYSRVNDIRRSINSKKEDVTTLQNKAAEIAAEIAGLDSNITPKKFERLNNELKSVLEKVSLAQSELVGLEASPEIPLLTDHIEKQKSVIDAASELVKARSELAANRGTQGEAAAQKSYDANFEAYQKAIKERDSSRALADAARDIKNATTEVTAQIERKIIEDSKPVIETIDSAKLSFDAELVKFASIKLKAAEELEKKLTPTVTLDIVAESIISLEQILMRAQQHLSTIPKEHPDYGKYEDIVNRISEQLVASKAEALTMKVITKPGESILITADNIETVRKSAENFDRFKAITDDVERKRQISEEYKIGGSYKVTYYNFPKETQLSERVNQIKSANAHDFLERQAPVIDVGSLEIVTQQLDDFVARNNEKHSQEEAANAARKQAIEEEYASLKKAEAKRLEADKQVKAREQAIEAARRAQAEAAQVERQRLEDVRLALEKKLEKERRIRDFEIFARNKHDFYLRASPSYEAFLLEFYRIGSNLTSPFINSVNNGQMIQSLNGSLSPRSVDELQSILNGQQVGEYKIAFTHSDGKNDTHMVIEIKTSIINGSTVTEKKFIIYGDFPSKTVTESGAITRVVNGNSIISERFVYHNILNQPNVPNDFIFVEHNGSNYVAEPGKEPLFVLGDDQKLVFENFRDFTGKEGQLGYNSGDFSHRIIFDGEPLPPIAGEYSVATTTPTPETTPSLKFPTSTPQGGPTSRGEIPFNMHDPLTEKHKEASLTAEKIQEYIRNFSNGEILDLSQDKLSKKLVDLQAELLNAKEEYLKVVSKNASPERSPNAEQMSKYQNKIAALERQIQVIKSLQNENNRIAGATYDKYGNYIKKNSDGSTEVHYNVTPIDASAELPPSTELVAKVSFEPTQDGKPSEVTTEFFGHDPLASIRGMTAGALFEDRVRSPAEQAAAASAAPPSTTVKRSSADGVTTVEHSTGEITVYDPINHNQRAVPEEDYDRQTCAVN